MAELEFIGAYTDPAHMPASGVEERLRAGLPVRGRYFLCVEFEGRHTLEIMEGAELVKNFYRDRHYRVIGVAGGKQEAFELLRRIVADYLATGGAVDGLRAYLRRRDLNVH